MLSAIAKFLSEVLILVLSSPVIKNTASNLLKSLIIKKDKSEKLDNPNYYIKKYNKSFKKINNISFPLQEQIRLNLTINRYGCYLLCLLYMRYYISYLIDKKERYIDERDICINFNNLVKSKLIKGENSFILDPNKILKELYIDNYVSFEGFRNKITERGFYIANNTNKTGLTHFTLFLDNSCIYNSIPNSSLVKSGYIQNYRYFKIIDKNLFNTIYS